jgi:hypothetical protein
MPETGRPGVAEADLMIRPDRVVAPGRRLWAGAQEKPEISEFETNSQSEGLAGADQVLISETLGLA